MIYISVVCLQNVSSLTVKFRRPFSLLQLLYYKAHCTTVWLFPRYQGRSGHFTTFTYVLPFSFINYFNILS